MFNVLLKLKYVNSVSYDLNSFDVYLYNNYCCYVDGLGKTHIKKILVVGQLRV